ncbi:Tetratricopeptide repeat-containing protein [Treponema bryantii]|uniref:Tetratricopeptide repeat-containing protein n=1 Tax=Treponema bryantii TaxID=163 RepID=A0A1I3M922_9SPIR|nr:tetratricopeptide repeat protein [Treponema bryantii]SFI93206.1 Tetratricopeptide repeat-containing protein [Treponema bryantii]
MLRDFKKFTAAAVICASVFMYAAASESASSAFVEACKSYSRGEWADAKFQLKKAVSYKENLNPDTYFMLIMAEVYDGDNKSALDDCNFYLENFSDSMYYSRVYYQKGKLLYSLGEYEKSIVVLSDFCHRYEKDELYSYALFYIGESLFAGYKYDEAGSVYERIVTEFPESPKTPAAQYRLETILQRGREEKLLYLLKQTGEEYLSAKEEYERQLRLYNSEAMDSTRQKLTAAQARNETLEKQVAELELQIAALKNNQAEADRIIAELKEAGEKDIPAPEPFDEKKYQLKLLKEKALEAQKMLDEKNADSTTEGK